MKNVARRLDWGSGRKANQDVFSARFEMCFGIVYSLLPTPYSLLPVHRVAVLALDSVVPFDLGVPWQVFGYGRPDAGAVRYACSLVGVRRGPVRTCKGFTINVPLGLAALRTADTIVVPGID